MTKADQATQTLIREANDNRYGYSWGGWGPWDFDCGHAVIDAWEKAGVPLKTVGGATWTGNMRDACLKCGFKDVTGLVNFSTGVGLKANDILLNRDNHAAQYIGDGRLVHARSSEGNEISGDQNGREFLVQSYFNYPWTHVLRYIAEDEPSDEKHTEQSVSSAIGVCGPETWIEIAKKMPTIESGSTGWAVTALQAALNYLGADLDADGEVGPLTESAIWLFRHGKE